MDKYNLDFQKIEDESTEFEEKVLHFLFHPTGDFHDKFKGVKLYDFEFILKYLIYNYSLIKTKPEDIERYVYICKNVFKKDFNAWFSRKDRVNCLEIQHRYTIYRVEKLTDIYPAFRFIFKDLETKERMGKCHQGAIDIARVLNRANVKCDVVTGFIYGLTDQSRFLHSWVETDGEMVYDFTLNACLNKNLYKKLQHYEELNRISGKDIEEDIQKLSSYKCTFSHIKIKEYLVYRDEFMSDMKKNSDKEK